ncbi:MAG: hypothetical protein ACFFG0_03980 [Candidatus Thorarchaeota archaeon]
MVPCETCIVFVCCHKDTEDEGFRNIENFILQCCFLRDYLVREIEDKYQKTLEVLYDEAGFYEWDTNSEFYEILEKVQIALKKDYDFIGSHMDNYPICSGDPFGDIICYLIEHKNGEKF